MHNPSHCHVPTTTHRLEYSYRIRCFPCLEQTLLKWLTFLSHLFRDYFKLDQNLRFLYQFMHLEYFCWNGILISNAATCGDKMATPLIISPVSEGSGDVMVLRRSRPPPATRHPPPAALVDTGDICCHYWQHILVVAYSLFNIGKSWCYWLFLSSQGLRNRDISSTRSTLIRYMYSTEPVNGTLCFDCSLWYLGSYNIYITTLVHLNPCWVGGGELEGLLVIVEGTSAWASYQICKIAVAYLPGMTGMFSPRHARVYLSGKRPMEERPPQLWIEQYLT